MYSTSKLTTYTKPTAMKIAKLVCVTLMTRVIVDDNADEQTIMELATPREQAIELASHYLSDGDLTVEQMVEAIYNHEDENELIDYVDGVVVWEKVEYSFTCEQFIQEIGYTK